MSLARNRSVFGVIAMIITGIVMSMMSGYYVVGEESGLGLVRSRWWWEVVLNLQILCAAFVWFTHTDRLNAASGAKFLVRALQMAIGMIAVLVPIQIAIAAALLGWFENPPPLEKINQIIVICLWIWAGLAGTLWAVHCVVKQRWVMPTLLRGYRWYRATLNMMPILLAIMLSIEETIRGGLLHYMFAPFLFYLQGAMPYLASSVHYEGQNTIGG